MEWHFINAMTWESATHAVRLVCTFKGQHWYAERKATQNDHVERLGRHETKELAVAACERDAYSCASGR